MLTNALLASCLLGREQIDDFIGGRSASFAEPDDKKKKRRQDAGRSAGTESPIDPRFDLPPAEAIDYFKAKKVVSKKVFNELSKEAQQSAFTVSGVYREDVLQGLKSELVTALKEGSTQQETIKRFKDILSTGKHQELGEFHLETVFRTNMSTAYSTGRRRGLEEITDAFPFWEYHTVGDDRVRPAHAALNGITLRFDNAFWNTHFPRWDFNCRCLVIPTDQIPDGYDPRHPSGDESVTVSYNDDGAPAKAEIGTSLVDLQVGKFSGIPRGASMLSAIEAGVERAKRP